jgi:hypothetical protein
MFISHSIPYNIIDQSQAQKLTPIQFISSLHAHESFLIQSQAQKLTPLLEERTKIHATQIKLQ